MFRYAATIFLSAFLLFAVQPLIGKYILPWFGGGSGVWTACMMFFQVMLLAGYGYAHVLIRYASPRWQTAVHLIVLLGCLAFLPIVPDSVWKPQSADDPTLRILVLLGVCLGGPYFALATTGPLLQAWFSRTHAGAAPYRLYALSNAGSLLGLLSYPFAVEPTMTRKAQAIAWSIGFAIFVLLCGWCALKAVRAPAAPIGETGKPSRSQTKKEPTSRFTAALWIALPACASVMLLSVTSQLSQEITPIPFLWVLPLAVYLLTFIIAFEWPRVYYRPVFAGLVLIAPWILLILLFARESGLLTQIALYLAVLFVCCMGCHGELYRLRPPPQKLTAYYLAIAAGGALGGAFVTLAAPLVFADYTEFYLGVFGSFGLMLASQINDPASKYYRGRRRIEWMVLIVLVLAAGFLIQLTLTAIRKDTMLSTRNFYGVLRIRVHNEPGKDAQYRKLEHGRIAHGAQIMTPPHLRRWPSMYYGLNSGVGITMRLFPKVEHRRVGVVGLGVGTMATYGQPGDVFRFYEINPQVKQLAETYFTYLQDSMATVDVVLGDARLSMEREQAQHYDVLVLDAFSGDAIPTHLLTREAFETYARHLNDDGVIAVHVTNRYLDLFPIVHRVAMEFGYETVFVLTDPDEPNLIEAAHWVLLTRNSSLLNQSELKQAGFWPQGRPRVPLWTDDYCSLIDIVRWTPPK